MNSEPSQTIFISTADAPGWLRYCFKTAESMRGTERNYMTPLFEQLGRFIAKAIAKNWKFDGVRHQGLTCDYWLQKNFEEGTFDLDAEIYIGYPKHGLAASA